MTPEETALRNRFYDVAREFLDAHAPDLSTDEPPDDWLNLDDSGEGGSQAHRAHVALVELLVEAYTQGVDDRAGVDAPIDGCPGLGRCHGPMKWCDKCGDVGDVCDVRVCDAHHRWGFERVVEGGENDHGFVEAVAEPGSVGAQLAARLGRPGPREVLVVPGVRDLRDVRLGDVVPAPVAGKEYLLVLADDDPIVGMLRDPASYRVGDEDDGDPT